MNYYDFLKESEYFKSIENRIDRYVKDLENIAATLGGIQIDLGPDNCRTMSDALTPIVLALYSIIDALTHDAGELLEEVK